MQIALAARVGDVKLSTTAFSRLATASEPDSQLAIRSQVLHVDLQCVRVQGLNSG